MTDIVKEALFNYSFIGRRRCWALDVAPLALMWIHARKEISELSRGEEIILYIRGKPFYYYYP